MFKVSIQFLNDQKPDTNATSIVQSFWKFWDFAYPDADIVSCALNVCHLRYNYASTVHTDNDLVWYLVRTIQISVLFTMPRPRLRGVKLHGVMLAPSEWSELVKYVLYF